MAIKIRQKYEKESILYTFIRKNIIDRNNVQDFRDAAISNIKNKQDWIEKLEWYKNDPSKFLQENWKHIDVQDFKDIVENIEKFYQTTISDFRELRYYQYITLFITYVFCKLHNSPNFKEEYLSFIANTVFEFWSDWDYRNNLDSSFNRLWYWMATASWKTIMMYAIAYMYVKLFSKDIRTLYILVPSDELRNQHANFLKIFWGFSWSTDTILTFNSLLLFNDSLINVKLTTISKMLNDEDWRNLDNNSIMIFDEAHRWASSTKEDSSTESLKNRFIEKSNTFLFEFSATFQNAFQADNKRISDIRLVDKNIFDRYIFSSIMKYNLYDFNSDGFWKCYYVNNLVWADDSTNIWKQHLICDSLTHLWLQLFAYETIKQENPEFKDYGTYIQHIDWTKLYYPLYMWLSRALLKRSWDKEDMDEKWWTSLVDMLENINYIFSHYDEFYDYIDEKIWSLYKDELRIAPWRANPWIIFKQLTWLDYKPWIYVGFKLRYDKQADEVKILLWNKKMLINTWSNSKVADFLKKHIPDLFSFEEQFWSGGRRFTNIDNDKDVLYVFGSKKFIEWWDSKRPSTIMLFKMWATSTIQATQILWRWLRLAWKDGDWFRHISERIKRRTNWDNHHTFLTEFVWLFWYEIDEFKKFIDQIAWDSISITVHKARTYTTSFLNYLIERKIDPNNEKAVNKFLQENFQYFYQEIEKTKPIEWVKLSANLDDKTQVKFYLTWDWWESDVWILKQNSNFLTTTRETWSIVRWTWTLGTTNEEITYTYNGLQTLWELWIRNFIKRMKNRYSKRNLSKEVWDAIEEIIKRYSLNTDYVSYEQVEWETNMFDIDLQNKIIRIFLQHLERVFESIDKHIHSIKEREIKDYPDWKLASSNFIKGLRISLSLKKDNDNYKRLLELFDIDETVHQLDENYDNLTDDQKRMFDPFFTIKGNDLHFYDRLYYVPANSSNDGHNHMHNVETDANVSGMRADLSDFKADPVDLNLNYNEESRIEKILEIVRSDKEFERYDIFYLRNLVWKDNWGIKFAYVESTWEFKYFFPDFLFRFLDKESGKRTVIYFEPKSAVDPNWELKEAVLNEKIWKDVDPCIVNLFNSASSGNETFWGWKII